MFGEWLVCGDILMCFNKCELFACSVFSKSLNPMNEKILFANPNVNGWLSIYIKDITFIIFYFLIC